MINQDCPLLHMYGQDAFHCYVFKEHCRQDATFSKLTEIGFR